MFGNILQEATGLLNRRFLINAFFPSLLFWGLLIIVVLIGQGNQSELLQSWNRQAPTFQLVQIVSFIGWVTFFAHLLESQMINILRFYEGYGYFPLFQQLGKSWHKKRLKKIRDNLKVNPTDSCYQKIYEYYPPHQKPEKVMPTRLGNILKNSEVYPLCRYRIDPVLIWSRLYNLFPERFIQNIAATKSDLDFMLTISFLSGAFAILSGLYLIVIGAAWWVFLSCFWGGLWIAGLAYQGALGSAILYTRQIKAGFDLYRNELLKQMRLPLPKNLADEQKQWRNLCTFLFYHFDDIPLDIRKDWLKELKDWHYTQDKSISITLDER